MLPSQHIFFGGFFSLLIFLIFPWIGITGFLIIFFSSFLIDGDHYIYYIFKKKDFNFFKAHKWYVQNEDFFWGLSRKERSRYYGGFFFLHGIEWLILFFLFAFFYYPFIFLFGGIGFHLLLDIIDEPRYWNRIDKVSIFYDFFKIKRLVLFNDY